MPLDGVGVAARFILLSSSITMSKRFISVFSAKKLQDLSTPWELTKIVFVLRTEKRKKRISMAIKMHEKLASFASKIIFSADWAQTRKWNKTERTAHTLTLRAVCFAVRVLRFWRWRIRTDLFKIDDNSGLDFLHDRLQALMQHSLRRHCKGPSCKTWNVQLAIREHKGANAKNLICLLLSTGSCSLPPCFQHFFTDN